MKILNVIGSIMGIIFTLLAVQALKPSTNFAFAIFAAWSCAPFILTFVLNVIHKNKVGIVVGVYLSLLIGAIAFFDIKYWNPDPQGGIVILMLPFVFFVVIIGSINLIKLKST